MENWPLDLIADLICALIVLVGALIMAGEMFGYEETRLFLFWLRGRCPKTGKPIRRFHL